MVADLLPIMAMESPGRFDTALFVQMNRAPSELVGRPETGESGRSSR